MRRALLAIVFLLSPTSAWTVESRTVTPATDAIDRQVCALLSDPEKAKPHDAYSDLSELDDLLVSTVYADVTGNGQLERLWIDDEGTMHSHTPRATSQSGADIPITEVFNEPPDADASPGPDSTDDEIDVNGTRWMVYGSRIYIVSFTDDGPNGYLRMVERLTKDHVAAPVCRFRSTKSVMLLSRDDPASREMKRDVGACLTIENGKARVLPTHPLRAAIKADVPGGYSTITKYVEGRLDNTSTTHRAYLRDISSGAGSGCDRQDYVSRQRGTSTAFDHALDELDDGSCAGSLARWVEVGGRIYLERQASRAAKPTMLQDEFHRVDVFENGKARLVCKAMFYTKTRVLTGVWNGHAWVKP